MADRYWVGGSGNTNDTAHISTTSGGAGGASLPTSIDNFIVDTNSNLPTNASYTITFAAIFNCLNFTVYAPSAGNKVTLSNGSQYNINVYGNVDLTGGVAGIITSFITPTMKATSGTKTIGTYGLGLYGLVLNGSGCTFQLLDDYNISSGSYFIISAGTFDPNGYTVTFKGATANIYGTTTFYNLTYTPTTAAKTNELMLTGNITVTNLLTISNGATATNRVLVKSDTLGTARTITAATVSFSNIDFQDITGAGNANWNLSAITGLSGDCGGNSVNITFTTPTTQDCSAGTTWSTATWSSRVPLPQDSATFSGSSRTITQDMPRIGSVNFTGSSGLTWTTSTVASVYGGINLTNLATLTASTQAYTFMGRGSYNLTSAGKTWGKNIYLDAPNGTLTLLSNLEFSGIRLFIITRGHFDANNFNLLLYLFSSDVTSTRTLSLGNGVWEIYGTTWNTANSTGLTLNKGLSTIKFTESSTSNKTFASGGKIFNNIWNATLDTGTFTISGSNTFNELKADAGRTTKLTTGTTTKISAIAMDGATLESTTTTPATLDLQNIVPLSALTNVTQNYITVINALGTIIYKTITTTLSIAGVITRLSNKVISKTQGISSVISRLSNKTITTTLSIAGVITRLSNKVISTTKGTSSVITRLSNKTISTTKGISSVISRLSNKIISTTKGTSSAVTRQTEKVISKTQGTSSAVTRQTEKVISTTKGSTSTMNRQINKVITKTQGNSNSVIRQINKVISKAQSSSSTMSRQINKTITNSSTCTGTVVKKTSKTVTSSLSLTSTISRAITKYILFSQASSQAVARKTNKQITTTKGFISSVNRQVNKVINRQQSATIVIVKQAYKVVSSSIAAILSVEKLTKKDLSVQAPTNATASKQTNKSIEIVMSVSATVIKAIEKVLYFNISLSAIVTRLAKSALILFGQIAVKKIQMGDKEVIAVYIGDKKIK